MSRSGAGLHSVDTKSIISSNILTSWRRQKCRVYILALVGNNSRHPKRELPYREIHLTNTTNFCKKKQKELRLSY